MMTRVIKIDLNPKPWALQCSHCGLILRGTLAATVCPVCVYETEPRQAR